MGRIRMKAGNSVKIKKPSNKWLYIGIAINTIVNIAILLKLYEVI